jgi:hypothetical protein
MFLRIYLFPAFSGKSEKIYILDGFYLSKIKMVIKARENSVGAWAFLMGVVLAIIVGLSTSLLSIPFLDQYTSEIYSILMILGLLIGFVSIPGRDSQTFLWAGAILVIISRFGMDSIRGSFIGIGIGDAVSSVFAALLALFVPATIVVALKTVFSIAKV